MRVRFAALTMLAIGGLAPAVAGQDVPWPAAEWPRSTGEAQGLEMAPLQDFHQRATRGEFGNVDRLVVIRNGYVVMSERYVNDYREAGRGLRGVLGCGADACDGAVDRGEYDYYRPELHPYYRGRDIHTLQSVTKSIAATMIGAAIHRGDIAGVEVPFLSFLGDYDLSRVDPRLRSASLADLLTMRSGIEWHEFDRPLDSTNTTVQLEYSDDWVRFTLDQPLDSDPGTKWAYNSGGSHLMSAIILRATGMTIDAYAERYLFGPLGITDYHWKRTPRGLPDTEGGLYLRAEDLARIGYLYLHDGVWDGQRLLPPGWVDAATTRAVESTAIPGAGYGYQWWRPDPGGIPVWAGMGFGDQYLLVFPEHDLVAVINSWNIFGVRTRSPLRGLLDALVAAVN